MLAAFGYDREQCNDLAVRTVRAAVEAAVFAERERCARVVERAWTRDDELSPSAHPGMIGVCDIIAKLVRTTT